MIRDDERVAEAAATTVSPDVAWQAWNIAREEREERNGHRGTVIWLTGMSAAGKTTIAREVERRLFARHCQTMLLDGDQVRHGLCGDLGFSSEERSENIRRAGEVAKLFFEQGSIVLCAFVSPYRKDRDRVRGRLPTGRFLEVLVEASLDTRQARDPKGLYQRARKGEISQFTGLSGSYEQPVCPDVIIDTDRCRVSEAASQIIDRLISAGLIKR